jgi:hypothetical protein
VVSTAPEAGRKGEPEAHAPMLDALVLLSQLPIEPVR